VRPSTPALTAGFACLLGLAPAAVGQGKATIAVAPFTFHRDVRAQPGAELETGTLTNKFVTALVQTRKFDVVERSRVDELMDEMALGDSGVVDPTRAVEAGRVLGADYFLMGEVSVFTLTTRVQHVKIADRWQRQEELTLIVDMRIVDTRTSRIVAAEQGEATYETRQMFRARPRADAPVEPATLDAIQRQVVEGLVIEVIDAVYPIRIISVNSNGVVAINRGEGGGVDVGMELDVFTEGEEMIDPDTGEVLGSMETKVARIRVSQVLAKFSKCSIVGGSPAVGNVCRPASGPADFAPAPPPPPPADTTPPRIRILAPSAGTTLNGNPVNVVAEVTDAGSGVRRVAISGRDATRDDRGRWRGQVRARDGGNRVRVEAWDEAGNRAEAAVDFQFDATPPGVEGEARILVEGTVDDLDCSLTINGVSVEYDEQTGRYSARVPPDPDDPGKVTIVAIDEFGNRTVEVRDVR